MKNLIAHRGLKKNEKENTIKAFQLAIQNKDYIGFECDVRTTKDHRFVINHNPMIKDQIISLTNYKDLKKQDIPTLESVLELKTEKIIVLEIKEHNIDTELFLKTINKYKKKNIYIMSFYNSVIKKLKKENQTYKLGVLNFVLNSEEDYKDYDFICLLESIITENLKNYFKEKNIEVFIYGIKNLKKIRNDYADCYYITDE